MPARIGDMSDEMSILIRRPILVYGSLAYLLFAVLVWTPLGDLILLWPFFFLLALQEWVDVSPASPSAASFVNVLGFALVYPWLAFLDRLARRHAIRHGKKVLMAIVVWYVPLLSLQLTMYVLVGWLGYPVGF